MNVYAIANSVIQSANQDIDAVWLRSTGYTTDAAGRRTNASQRNTVRIQVQGLSAGELAHTDGLNIQGVRRAVYMFGNLQGVVRADKQGGDILQFPEIPGQSAKDWRVVHVLETWPEWSKVVVVMQ